MKEELLSKILKDINLEISKSEISYERETRREHKKYHKGTIEGLKRAKEIIIIESIINGM